MVQELDHTFDALMFCWLSFSRPDRVAIHLHIQCVVHMSITLKLMIIMPLNFFCMEFSLPRWVFPVAFISGDSDLCYDAKEINENITTIAVKQGIGDSTLNIHPKEAIEKIWQGAESALKSDLSKCLLPTSEEYKIELRFKKHQQAYNASFYPGCKLVGQQTISFTTKEYYEVMRMMHFVIK